MSKHPRTQRTPRRFLAAVAGVLAVGLLAACGSSGGSSEVSRTAIDPQLAIVNAR